ncbi:uncharacterized protein LOC128198451 [Bicyclus anynana]|uniref:Uncharacterized protein LOC128198451 n=1 Tax=Bicyclus anynana TaxID=110368 RepID=A0ABM3LLL8_BICAN|nr:uncharacterized protein LOC128198451 [Bicyclus anynana]
MTESKRGAVILQQGQYMYRKDYIHNDRITWRCVKRHSGCKATCVIKGSKLIKISADIGARYATMNGRRVLLIGNYRFMKHYDGRNGRTRWRCSMEVIQTSSGYPKLMYCGFLYRPHNAYRHRRLQLWYCRYRNTRQCRAIVRTMDGHIIKTEENLFHSFGLIGTGIDCFASYCLSKQGKMGINVGGYRFRFNGCARNGKIRWRCSRGPWCKAALHTYRGRIVYIQSTHNCGPKPPS